MKTLICFALLMGSLSIFAQTVGEQPSNGQRNCEELLQEQAKREKQKEEKVEDDKKKDPKQGEAKAK